MANPVIEIKPVGEKWVLFWEDGQKICSFHDQLTAYKLRRTIYELWK